MGGKEAAAHILEYDPAAKLIVASGYSNDTVIANYEDYGFKGVIAKPFTTAQIREVLDKVLINS